MDNMPAAMTNPITLDNQFPMVFVSYDWFYSG